ncbi:MAG: hypothetical protein DIU67_002040 [Actinomycetes bacterium]|nr:MAG: hypothetical protein DIU67_01690 [Actinomycetota bacterium]
MFKLGLGSMLLSVLGRPALWGEAIRVAISVRRRGRLGPSAAYLRWRSHTAYGDVMAIPSGDFVAYLRWRKQMRAMR